MPTLRKTFEVKAPFKGMLTGNNPQFNPAYFTKAYNIVFDKQDVPNKRPGVTKITDSVIYNTSTGFTFNNVSPPTITDTGSGFTNFVSGHRILVSGTTNNDGVYVVQTAVAGTLTLKATETLVNESPASATVYDLAPIDGLYEYTIQGTVGSPSKKWIFNIDKYIIASRMGADPVIANAIKSDATAGKADYAILQDVLYIANGNDVLQKYTGTGNAADVDTPPDADTGLTTGTFTPSIIETHQWCLWAAGVPGHPSRIFKSCPLDGTDFKTNYAAMDPVDGYALAGAAVFDVRPDDGTKITGLIGDHFGQLVIFKEKSIHRILGATKADYVMPPEGIINGIGAYNGTIVRANNDIYFADKKGIHRLSTVQEFGDNAQSYISFPIQEFYNGIDKGQIDECASCHWPDYNLFLWAFQLQGSARNNIVIVYDYLGGTWAIWTGLEISTFGLMSFYNKEMPYIGDYYGRFCRFNPSMMNDYGAAFTAELETMLDFGDSYLVKGYRNFLLNFNPVGGSIDVKFKVDDGQWGATNNFVISNFPILGNFLLGFDSLVSSARNIAKQAEVNRSGRKLWVNMQNSTINEKMSILGFGGQFVPQGYYQPLASSTGIAQDDIRQEFDPSNWSYVSIIYQCYALAEWKGDLYAFCKDGTTLRVLKRQSDETFSLDSSITGFDIWYDRDNLISFDDTQKICIVGDVIYIAGKDASTGYGQIYKNNGSGWVLEYDNGENQFHCIYYDVDANIFYAGTSGTELYKNSGSGWTKYKDFGGLNLTSIIVHEGDLFIGYGVNTCRVYKEDTPGSNTWTNYLDSGYRRGPKSFLPYNSELYVSCGYSSGSYLRAYSKAENLFSWTQEVDVTDGGSYDTSWAGQMFNWKNRLFIQIKPDAGNRHYIYKDHTGWHVYGAVVQSDDIYSSIIYDNRLYFARKSGSNYYIHRYQI